MLPNYRSYNLMLSAQTRNTYPKPSVKATNSNASTALNAVTASNASTWTLLQHPRTSSADRTSSKRKRSPDAIEHKSSNDRDANEENTAAEHPDMFLYKGTEYRRAPSVDSTLGGHADHTSNITCFVCGGRVVQACKWIGHVDSDSHKKQL
jgi:hypothetical protein